MRRLSAKVALPSPAQSVAGLRINTATHRLDTTQRVDTTQRGDPTGGGTGPVRKPEIEDPDETRPIEEREP